MKSNPLLFIIYWFLLGKNSFKNKLRLGIGSLMNRYSLNPGKGITGLLVLLLLFSFLVSILPGSAEAGVSFTQKYNFMGNVDYKVIGNSRLKVEGYYQCNSSPSSTTSSTLSLPAGATVRGAYLYWSGSGNSQDSTVSLNGVNVNAQRTYLDSSYEFGTYYYNYSSFADVTNRVNSSGTYSVSGISFDKSYKYCDPGVAYATWSLVVVYEDSSLPDRNINIYDGLVATRWGSTTTIANLTGLNFPNDCAPEGEITMVVSQGDHYKGETLWINNQTIGGSNPLNGSSNGQIRSQLDIDTYDLDGYAGPGTTNIVIKEHSPVFYNINGYSSASEIAYFNVFIVANNKSSNCNKASLGDRVWEDLNQNGIQDSGEPGVPGVTVQLKNASGQVIDTTVTNNNGKYLFTDLAPGDYSVNFIIPDGFTASPQDQGGNDAADSDGMPTGNPNVFMTPVTTLSTNENDLTWDQGIFETQSVIASIGDRVWLDSDQDGIQDAGEPGVEGVTVQLKDNTGSVINTILTDSNGNYQFTELQPGDYSINFIIPDGFTASPQDQGGNDSTDSDGMPTGDINVYMTPVTTLDPNENDPSWDQGIFETQSILSSIGNRVWLDNDQDGIQDPDEPGVEGVTVQLKNSSGDVIDTTTTDSNGNYQFTELDSGDYSINFVIPDGFSTSPKDQGSGGTVEMFMTSGPGTTRDANLRQTSPDTNYGDVTLMTPDLVQQDPDNNKFGQVMGVVAWDINSIPSNAIVQTVEVTLNLVNVSSGTYNLFEAKVPWTEGGVNWNTFSAPSAVGTDVLGTITPGVFGDNVITLNSTGITLVQNWINGNSLNNGFIIRDSNTNDGIFINTSEAASGQPKIKVTYLVPNEEDEVDSDGMPTGDPNVFMTIVTTLDPGEEDLTWDQGIFQASSGVASIGDRVWLDNDQDGIQDAGEPGVSGVTVHLKDNAGNIVATTQTNGNGNYLFSNLTPGNYSIGFVIPQNHSASPADQGGNNAVDSDGLPTTDPDFYMTAVTNLESGENDLTWDQGIFNVLSSLGDRVWNDLDQNGVQDPGEPGVAGVTVQLKDSDGDVILETTTNSDGNYSFEGLEPGDYSVNFVLPNGFQASPQDQGNDISDSDGMPTGDPNVYMTPVVTLNPGENNPTLDQGIYSVGDICSSTVYTYVNNDFITEDGHNAILTIKYEESNDAKLFKFDLKLTRDSADPAFPSQISLVTTDGPDPTGTSETYLRWFLSSDNLVAQTNSGTPINNFPGDYFEDIGSNMRRYKFEIEVSSILEEIGNNDGLAGDLIGIWLLSENVILEVSNTPTEVTLDSLCKDKLVSTDDATIRRTSPDLNEGNEVEIVSDGVSLDPNNGKYGEVAAVVSWDLSSIPSNAIVETVNVVLNLTDPSSGDYNLLEIQAPWDENNVTWNSIDVSTNVGSTVLGVIQPLVFGINDLTLNEDGISIVQGWINGSIPNNGIAIRTGGSNNGIFITSKEGNNNQPMICISYRLPGDPPPSGTFTDDFQGGDDSLLRQSSGDTNYGSETSLNADLVQLDPNNGKYGETMSVLSWDISSIPATAVIQSASITIDVSNTSGGIYNLHEALANWAENAVTWNSFGGSSANVGSDILGSTTPGVFGNLEIALTGDGVNLIQGWVDGSIPNYGVVFKTGGTNDGIFFNSSEAGSGQPKLTITYTVGGL